MQLDSLCRIMFNSLNTHLILLPELAISCKSSAWFQIACYKQLAEL